MEGRFSIKKLLNKNGSVQRSHDQIHVMVVRELNSDIFPDTESECLSIWSSANYVIIGGHAENIEHS